MWNGSKWIRVEKRAAIYIRDAWRCVYCGCFVQPTMEKQRNTATLDHLLPRELGGGNNVQNLVTCCSTCNSAKQDRSVREFIHYLHLQNASYADGVAKRIRNAKRRKLPRPSIVTAIQLRLRREHSQQFVLEDLK